MIEETAQVEARVYRKTATIRASQWFKMGDHPAVILKEGIAWVETLEGGYIVTPGDWIATGVKGEHWPIQPDVFAASYEPVENTRLSHTADPAPFQIALRRALVAAGNILCELEAHCENTGEDLELEDQAVVFGAKQDLEFARTVLDTALSTLSQEQQP